MNWRRLLSSKPHHSRRRQIVGHQNVEKTTENDHTSAKAGLIHALVIIFLEFFAWGLLTNTTISVLKQTFPHHTFLMNGLVQGVKGFLSFLSAPLIGALSDVWGRKPFLLLTVGFTCAPIPLLKISQWWYFTMISISGLFAVTFSVIFAYVADVTYEHERSQAYGLVSATFAASLVTSPAIGAYLGNIYGDHLVVAMATAIAMLDILLIMTWVPESLPERLRMQHFSWDKADPFGALRRIGADRLLLVLCIAVLLSYLPEAGEFSAFFVYLRLVIGFSSEEVSSFIAVVGILSVIAQGVLLTILMNTFGHVNTIVIGLVCEAVQLVCYGLGTQSWIIWTAGVVASMSSITYPAISAYASTHFKCDQQGVSQGVLTGVRGLCNGLGPAMFGLLFYLFHVDLSEHNVPPPAHHPPTANPISNATSQQPIHVPRMPLSPVIPGPPFLFGAILVILAILVASMLPNDELLTAVIDKRAEPAGAALRKERLRNSSRRSRGVASRAFSLEPSDELLQIDTSRPLDATPPAVDSPRTTTPMSADAVTLLGDFAGVDANSAPRRCPAGPESLSSADPFAFRLPSAEHTRPAAAPDHPARTPGPSGLDSFYALAVSRSATNR